MSTGLTMGQRVARARRRRGWDQAALAAAVGRSVSWVSKVENGRMPLDRMSVVAQLAETLGVEITELTGQPYRHDSAALDSGHAAIPAIRLALQHATIPGGAALLVSGDPPALGALSARVAAAEVLRQAAKFSLLGDVLPSIIRDLVVLCDIGEGDDRDVAESLMLRASHMARVASNLLGHHDLSWTAVQRELVAAEHSGRPELVAAARWDLCGVWLHEGQLVEARDVALRTLNELEAYVGGGNPTVQSLWGAMHLRAAVAFSRMWSREEAESHLQVARAVAETSARDGNVFQTQFNAANVDIHAAEISLELGHPRDALSRARAVQIQQIASGERLAHYWTCAAAGELMNSHPDRAAEALLTADSVAPQHVRNKPLVHSLVRDLRSTGGYPQARAIQKLADQMRLA